jgi:hypothetical protein
MAGVVMRRRPVPHLGVAAALANPREAGVAERRHDIGTRDNQQTVYPASAISTGAMIGVGRAELGGTSSK